MLVVHTVCQFCAFSVQPGKPRGNIRSLPFIVSLQIPVFLLGDFTVFPVLIKRLLVACYLCQFPLFCSYQIVQSVRLAFFDWSGIDLRDDFRVGNSLMYLMLYSEQNSSLQPFMLD